MQGDHGAILVVDDQETNRTLLARLLEREAYTVVLASNGREALDTIEQRPIALMLLDVMMPGLDGVQVLQELRRRHSPTSLPIIMVTARGDTEDVVRALTLGANDYLTKPLDLPVVLARVRTQMSLHSTTTALEAAHTRMARDLAAAARIQRALLPRPDSRFAGVRFAWSVAPCDELAGDALNILRLDDRFTAVYLIDVSGHGISAALLSVTLCHMLSPLKDNTVIFDGGATRRPRPPVDVARRLNEQFPIDIETRQYFTIAYGLLDGCTRELRYVCAGHPGPILVAADGGVTPQPDGDLPIGWAPDPEFREHRLALCPGDRVYLYSDGVPETRNAEGVAFGAARLQTTIDQGRAKSLDASVTRLCADLDRWSSAPRTDDVSVLALEIVDGG